MRERRKPGRRIKEIDPRVDQCLLVNYDKFHGCFEKTGALRAKLNAFNREGNLRQRNTGDVHENYSGAGSIIASKAANVWELMKQGGCTDVLSRQLQKDRQVRAAACSVAAASESETCELRACCF